MKASASGCRINSQAAFTVSAYHIKVIAELQAHDLRSTQFFNIAAGYFHRRYRNIQACCVFFFFLAALSILLFFITTMLWWCSLVLVSITSSIAYFCWAPFRLGIHAKRMIYAARHLDQHHQLDCLEFLAIHCQTRKNMKYFWGADPVAIYILMVLRREIYGPDHVFKS